MRRISLVILGISALLIGLTQHGSTGAVAAKAHASTPRLVQAEPTEQQMRQAFEDYLTGLVSHTLAFIAESGGSEAVRKVRQSGNDRFEVGFFRKFECSRSPRATDYVCGFAVDVKVTNGAIERTLSGRFAASPNGFVFADLK